MRAYFLVCSRARLLPSCPWPLRVSPQGAKAVGEREEDREQQQKPSRQAKRAKDLSLPSQEGERGRRFCFFIKYGTEPPCSPQQPWLPRSTFLVAGDLLLSVC